MVPLLAAVFIAALLSAGGAAGVLFYLAKSGRLLGGRAPLAAGRSYMERPVPNHLMVLEPIVANLADPDGTAYLKMSLTLRIADPPSAASASPKKEEGKDGAPNPGGEEASVRDTVLSVVGQQNSTTLLASNGKQALKTQLKAALEKSNPGMKLLDLYFTDFLIQR